MLIVLEGNDGSGKATQANLLVEALREAGKDVQTIDFPRYYDNFFGGFVAECLRGEHGDFVDMDPKIASMLFAFDRFEAKDQILNWIEAGNIVIADRYTTANMVHQGGKISDDGKQEEFLCWLETLEYDTLGLPRPNMVVYLDVPVEVSLKNLATKNEGYAAGKKDQHEGDAKFLERSRQAALRLASQDQAWRIVACAQKGIMRSRNDIHKEIMQLIHTAS